MAGYYSKRVNGDSVITSSVNNPWREQGFGQPKVQFRKNSKNQFNQTNMKLINVIFIKSKLTFCIQRGLNKHFTDTKFFYVDRKIMEMTMKSNILPVFESV